MLATSYLPRRWPAKYCHRCESLRPCSGWERVFSSLFVTSEFFRSLCTKSCIDNINSRFHQFFHLPPVQLKLLRSLRFRYTHNGGHSKPSLATCLSCFRKPTPLLRFVHLFRKSPRPISNARLKMLPLLHLHPINQVICLGTY